MRTREEIAEITEALLMPALRSLMERGLCLAGVVGEPGGSIRRGVLVTSNIRPEHAARVLLVAGSSIALDGELERVEAAEAGAPVALDDALGELFGSPQGDDR